MFCKVYLLIFLFFLSLIKISKGEDYTIKTLQGVEVNVLLREDYVNNLLVIAYSNDTIYIDNFTGLDSMPVRINDHFLKIQYRIRGGIGRKVRNCVFFCIKEQLTESLHITSYDDYLYNQSFDDVTDFLQLFFEAGTYMTRLDLQGETIDEYSIKVGIHNYRQSKQHANDNFEYDKNVRLYFDKSQNIFYSELYDVNGVFKIYDPELEKEITRKILGSYPTAILDDRRYYYIDGYWYEQSFDDHLYKMSFRRK
jgi:hypothetical protein